MARFHSWIPIRSFLMSTNSSSDKRGLVFWRSHVHFVCVPTLDIRFSCVLVGARALHRVTFISSSVQCLSLLLSLLLFSRAVLGSMPFSSCPWTRRFVPICTFRSHVFARTCLDSMFPSTSCSDVSHVHVRWSLVVARVRMVVLCAMVRASPNQGRRERLVPT